MAKDGSTFYVNTTVVPILDRFGDIEEFIAIRYDVTKEVELRLQNEQKQRLLFLQSRQASLGQMIANIAHQWKQPLTELNLALFNLQKSFNSDSPEEFQKYYKNSKDVVKNMSDIIDNFMNFFKPAREKSFFQLSKSIYDALTIVKKLLKNEKINIDGEVEDIELFGISNELSQVLINIIQNASEAFVQNNIQNRKVTITAKQVKKDFVMEISNNAGNIPADVIDNIFEPYFTTKHSKSGTGLGLFIASMIVEQTFDGTIIAKNTNDGASFIITIPIVHKKGCKCCA